MSTNLVIKGIKIPRSDELTLPAEVLDTVIVLFPDARMALDPDRKPRDAEFIRSLVKRQNQAAVGRINAQDLVECIAGSRRLAALRDYVNADPERWGVPQNPDGSFVLRPYRIKIVRAANDMEALDILVSENKDRAEPSAVNLAATAAAYEDRFGLTREEIGARMGFTASRVGQLFQILKHTDRVKALVHSGRLPESTARTMLGLSAEKIEEIAVAVELGAKPREVLAAVKDAHRDKGKRMPRTIAELRTLLNSIDSDRSAAMANWVNGLDSADPEVFLSDAPFVGRETA